MFETNLAIADQLRKIASLYSKLNMSKKGFAFSRAANSIATYDKDITTLTDFTGIKFVGEAITSEVFELLARGTSSRLQSLQTQLGTPDLSDIERLPGVGPVKAKKLWETFGTVTLDQMRKFIDNKIITDKDLIEKLEFVERSSEFESRSFCEEAGLKVINLLKPYAITPNHITFAGSIRRKRDLVRDIDILIATLTPMAELRDLLTNNGFKINYGGDFKIRIEYNIMGILRGGDIIFTTEDSWGCALNYLTGSADFNIGMRSRAKSFGLTINEHCVSIIDNDKFNQRFPNGLYPGKFIIKDKGFIFGNTVEIKEIYIKEEIHLFELLGIPWVAPELRTGSFRIGENFSNIISQEPEGDLHIHTNASDGNMFAIEIAKEAKKLGLTYIGFSDHTKSLPKGVAEDKVKDYAKVIREISESVGIKCYAGLEVEVTSSMDLVYSVETLRNLDYVNLSIHHAIGTNMVERYLSALKVLNKEKIPAILCHMTGRSFRLREEAKDDWKKLFIYCSENNVLIEINCVAERLDPSNDLIELGATFGCKFIAGSDTHWGIDLKALADGFYKARAGRVKPKYFINTHEKLKMWLNSHK